MTPDKWAETYLDPAIPPREHRALEWIRTAAIGGLAFLGFVATFDLLSWGINL